MEILFAVALLALVTCGTAIFLQASLIYYRRESSAVRGALAGQFLLERLSISKESVRGGVDEFLYQVDFQPTAEPKGSWVEVRLYQENLKLTTLRRWKPSQTLWVEFCAFDSKEWSRIEVDGPGEEPGRLPGGVRVEGNAIVFRGEKIHQDSWPLFEPRLNSTQTQVAFLRQEGADCQVLTLDLKTRRSRCWRQAHPVTEPPCWLGPDELLICVAARQLVRIGPRSQEVLYEAEGLSAPSLSPEGERLCFVSHPEDNHEIFLMDLRQKVTKNLTNSPEGEIRPLWSDRGDRILFGQASEAGGTKLGCIRPDGTGRQDLQVVATGNDWNWVVP